MELTIARISHLAPRSAKELLTSVLQTRKAGLPEATAATIRTPRVSTRERYHHTGSLGWPEFSKRSCVPRSSEGAQACPDARKGHTRNR